MVLSHPTEVGDRVDDLVEIVAPVPILGDEDFGPPGPVDEHRRLVGVFLHEVLAAVNHRKVRAAYELVGADVIRRQEHRLVVTKPAVAQCVDETVPGERLPP